MFIQRLDKNRVFAGFMVLLIALTFQVRSGTVLCVSETDTRLEFLSEGKCTSGDTQSAGKMQVCISSTASHTFRPANCGDCVDVPICLTPMVGHRAAQRGNHGCSLDGGAFTPSCAGHSLSPGVQTRPSLPDRRPVSPFPCMELPLRI